MPCKVGYPKSPCPFGHEGRVTRLNCSACKNYEPPPHILSWCMLYDREGIICKLPLKACEECPDKHERRPGRPHSEEGETDWRDPASVRAYFRKYQAEGGRGAQHMLAFLARHPDYFKQYRERNRERMRAAALRWYHKHKKNEGQ